MPVTVSWSELSDLRQCPLKHRLAWVDRWAPPTVGPALARGITWHQLMEIHYNAIRSTRLPAGRRLESAAYKMALRQIRQLLHQDDTYVELTPPEQAECDLLTWMYTGYVERYGDDPEWEIVMVEARLEADLPPVGLDTVYRIKMRLDLVVRELGRLWLVDHKTDSRSDLTKAAWADIDLDDQFGLYTWGMRTLGEEVMGSIRNAAKSKQLKRDMSLEERYGRTRTQRTAWELDRIAIDAALTADLGYNTYAKLDLPPRHTDPERCKYRCGYLEPCLDGRKGRSVEDQLLSRGFRIDLTRH